MQSRAYPILEFDPEPDAILTPGAFEFNGGLPEAGVLCFFADVLNQLVQEGRLVPIGELRSEIGPNLVYELQYEGRRFFVTHPGVGAPLAAGFLDELIGSGARKALACGGCGVLGHDIVAGHAIIVTSAVRDEGTSYHYLAPCREAYPHASAVRALEETLKAAGVDYILGKTWTTDAIYRETRAKRDLRMAEDCQTVEMEASAFFAVAEFRRIVFGQLLYGGDLVIPEGWDHRDWFKRKDIREAMFWLTVQACAKL
jgi:uridine phosphorylase